MTHTVQSFNPKRLLEQTLSSFVFLIVGLGVLTASAQPSQDVRASSVGLPAKIDQIVLPAPKVIARKIENRDQPIILRIVETYPHGDQFRYDLEYYGLEPGSFNLADYLVNEDLSPSKHLPEILVEITTIVPAGKKPAPNQVQGRDAGFLNIYSPLLLAGGAVWVLGLVALIFVGRGKTKRLSRKKVEITMADRLRPLVELAISGELDSSGKAELERTLEAFWKRKLRLKHVPASELRVHLREHPEAKIMLGHLDSWLHRPGDSENIDVNELLKPYQDVNSEEL